MSDQDKRKKQNIILMLALAIIFIIGILTRWEETKTAIVESINSYINITNEK